MDRLLIRFGVGFAAGAIIAAIDSYAFGGEISPIAIVILLLGGSVVMGFLWGRRGWVAGLAMWIGVPLFHVFKHIWQLPDTLQPNTYASILLLAGFTLVIVSIGTVGGAIMHKGIVDPHRS